jgi:hypothetical protein
VFEMLYLYSSGEKYDYLKKFNCICCLMYGFVHCTSDHMNNCRLTGECHEFQ